jgi:hypothetical protein
LRFELGTLFVDRSAQRFDLCVQRGIFGGRGLPGQS